MLVGIFVSCGGVSDGSCRVEARDGCEAMMRLQSSLSNLDALGSLPPSNDGNDNISFQETTGGDAPLHVWCGKPTLLPVRLVPRMSLPRAPASTVMLAPAVCTFSLRSNEMEATTFVMVPMGAPPYMCGVPSVHPHIPYN